MSDIGKESDRLRDATGGTEAVAMVRNDEHQQAIAGVYGTVAVSGLIGALGIVNQAKVGVWV